MSLEELVNLKVTSVSKKEESLKDAAAAIFVLSNEDLRRSAVTNIPDALRLVPGVQVALIDPSNWAVSARGFNSQFSNKLLVMLDGRSVYTPLFSGVYWDAQQVFLEDVERIEVIRGPGATVWGSNAVNGVVNIISKSARDTQGGLAYGGGGNVHNVISGVRYGDKISTNTFYRVYATYQEDDDYPYGNGTMERGGWDLLKGGFRVDSYPSNGGHLSWITNFYAGDLSGEGSEINGLNTLGRWKHEASDRSSYELQAYIDHAYRNNAQVDITIDTFDITLQQTLGLGDRNDLIWGVGYRYLKTTLHRANVPGSVVMQNKLPLDLFSAFIQNKYQVIPETLSVVLGTKIEHNDFTGFEIQPSFRFTYKPADNQTIWGAVSRAVRTPSQSEGQVYGLVGIGTPTPGPGGVPFQRAIMGNPDAISEVLYAYELGYRYQSSSRFSLDIALFLNNYNHLSGRYPAGVVPATPVNILKLKSENMLDGHSYGGEISLSVEATDSWRMAASYSLLLVDIHGLPANDVGVLEENAPTHQVVIRSSHDFNRSLSVDAQLRYVDQVNFVDGYVTADLRLSYQVSSNLELTLVGQNLLDKNHYEQMSLTGAALVEVPRSFYAKATWRF